MARVIPLSAQYQVEKERNTKYLWLAFSVAAGLLILHGVLFYWIPRILRSKRRSQSLRFPVYFKLIKHWDTLTSCVGFRCPYKRRKVYFQPSVMFIALLFLGIMTALTFSEIDDLTYQPPKYIICKRISRLGIGTLPVMLALLMKNDIITSITGLQYDRLQVLHKWLGRYLFVIVTIHMALAFSYWLPVTIIMLRIPPQIFGYISYSCLGILTFGLVKWMRTISYEVFLVLHRVAAFIMLLLAYFHSKGNRPFVLIAVHVLVADRLTLRAISFVHSRKSPTKGKCEFQLLDDETVLVTIPVRDAGYTQRAWYTRMLPQVRHWKAGQHIYLTVSKVSRFQNHPFTISSMSEDGEMKLVIRQQKGFTKQLMATMKKLELEDAESALDEESAQSSSSSNAHDPAPKRQTYLLKASFHGPYGSTYQPLFTFDVLLFFAAGSGASFVLPAALDLLRDLDRRDANEDYISRPETNRVHIVLAFQKAENINWYRHILEPIAEHCVGGRAILDIFVTRENPQGKVEMSDEKYMILEELLKQKGINFTIDTVQTEVTSSLISEVHSAPLGSKYDLTPTHYGRPNLNAIITDEAASLFDSGLLHYKSLAVVSCGPREFTNVIKVECQRNRKLPNSPDIYCYSESF